jgi:hypothetical protein
MDPIVQAMAGRRLLPLIGCVRLPALTPLHAEEVRRFAANG